MLLILIALLKHIIDIVIRHRKKKLICKKGFFIKNFDLTLEKII